MRPHRVAIEHLTAPGTPNRPASDWGERGEPDGRGPRCDLPGDGDQGAFLRRRGLVATPRGDRVASS
jgi:hypothetical protein